MGQGKESTTHTKKWSTKVNVISGQKKHDSFRTLHQPSPVHKACAVAPSWCIAPPKGRDGTGSSTSRGCKSCEIKSEMPKKLRRVARHRLIMKIRNLTCSVKNSLLSFQLYIQSIPRRHQDYTLKSPALFTGVCQRRGKVFDTRLQAILRLGNPTTLLLIRFSGQGKIFLI